jgi:hypothetical protein
MIQPSLLSLAKEILAGWDVGRHAASIGDDEEADELVAAFHSEPKFVKTARRIVLMERNQRRALHG